MLIIPNSILKSICRNKTPKKDYENIKISLKEVYTFKHINFFDIKGMVGDYNKASYRSKKRQI